MSFRVFIEVLPMMRIRYMWMMISWFWFRSVPAAAPPYICYVTLPGGSCFGSYGVSGMQTKPKVDFFFICNFFQLDVIRYIITRLMNCKTAVKRSNYIYLILWPTSFERKHFCSVPFTCGGSKSAYSTRTNSKHCSHISTHPKSFHGITEFY